MSEPIVYLLKSAGLCGGVRVVLEHVYRLNQRGYDASIYYLEDSPDWFGKPIPGRQFSSVDEMTTALRKFNGIKVATWFETAYWLANAVNGKDRPYYLVQDIEESYAILQQQKEWILNTYKLGLKPITTSQWAMHQLAERFGQKAALVSLGVDFNKFKPIPEMKRDQYRVFTQCRVWTAGPNLKGWTTAKKAVEAAFEEDKAVSLVTFGVEARQGVRSDLPHIHIQRPSDAHLNEMYASSGLYLLTSNHEGFGLTAAEAMAVGIPVVATRAHGNEEFCFHGKTALMADVGDWQTLSSHILNLFHNADYAEAIATQGQEYIKQYTWDRSIDALEHEFFGKGAVIKPNVDPPSYATIGKAGCDIEYPVITFDADPTAAATVVIPTVNEVKKVKECVESIRRTTLEADIEIIVVDDGTKDEKILRELHQLSRTLHFKLLMNEMNLGFSATVNRGILRANGRYVILCNNDITFVNDWLYPLIKLGDMDRTIGVIGAKLLYPTGLVQHAGMIKVPNALHFPHMGHGKTRDDPEVNENKYVWSVTGAVFAIRRETLEHLGGLSTAYATAWEDVDYCLNAWRNGWRVAYCHATEAVHQEGGTRGATYDEKKQKPLIWMEREKAGESYFMKKWAGLTYAATPQDLKGGIETGNID